MNKQVKVAKSSIHGKGVIACRNLFPGELILTKLRGTKGYGGYNHSCYPNTVLVRFNESAYCDKDKVSKLRNRTFITAYLGVRDKLKPVDRGLIAMTYRIVKKGEELTVPYPGGACRCPVCIFAKNSVMEF